VRINARGLPHSEIPGSKPVCGSPELIAAYHVLHRHLAPRHSPYALSSLTIDMRTNAGVRIAFASYPAALILFGTLRVFCGRKKLPFAGYSIVKERRRRLTFVRRNFLSYVRSLARCKRPAPDSPPCPSPGNPATGRARRKGIGEYRARTGDLLVANQALSQLS
jgi:hypothetical protein